MIRQTILPFKLETTKDLITAHAGLALFGEFAVGLGLKDALDKNLPGPDSGAEYAVSEHIFPLILMLNGGSRSLEDLREIREDIGLREVLGIERMASSDATGDWLRRSGMSGGLEGLGNVNGRFLKWALKRDKRKGYGMERMRIGTEGNAVFFRIGVIAYNLGKLFLLTTLDESWHRHQVQTVRWKLYGVAGKVVFRGHSVYLKVRCSIRELFARVRVRSWEFAQT